MFITPRFDPQQCLCGTVLVVWARKTWSIDLKFDVYNFFHSYLCICTTNCSHFVQVNRFDQNKGLHCCVPQTIQENSTTTIRQLILSTQGQTFLIRSVQHAHQHTCTTIYHTTTTSFVAMVQSKWHQFKRMTWRLKNNDDFSGARLTGFGVTTPKNTTIFLSPKYFNWIGVHKIHSPKAKCAKRKKRSLFKLCERDAPK